VNAQYSPHDTDRLTAADLTRLRTELVRHGVTLSFGQGVSVDATSNEGTDAPERLMELRALYEPYLHALSRRLLMTLPPWVHSDHTKDNWQSGPWDRAIQARALEHPGRPVDDHF
jgi:hypothetical protein